MSSEENSDKEGMEEPESCGEVEEEQQEETEERVSEPEEREKEQEEEELSKEELEEEVEELESSLKKVMADFDNYKKRMVKEKQRIRRLAAEDLMKDLIEVLDDLERALDNENEVEKEGIEMIYRKFSKVLKDHGLEEIDTEDEKFDPMYHECVRSEEKEEVEKDKILEEYQKGYKLNDKVIRPSRVKVAR
ncbi:MAG: nucleotide exchange factor GrpE [Candidatus Natronoplasma sp.]